MRLAARQRHVRTLIVNGEPGVRAQLHRLCVGRADLHVVAEVTNGAQAIDVIHDTDAHLLLLDARLPDMSGSDVLRSLNPEVTPSTIMMSSRNEADPKPAGVDVKVLYKPVNAAQFNEAVDQAINARVADVWPLQIVGEKAGRIYFLDAHDVEYLASAGNYVVAHVGTNEYLTRATLKRIATRMAPLGFVQIERSLLINIRQLSYVEKHDRSQFCFVMRSGTRLVSSRERSGEIRAFLSGVSAKQA
jgi:two-component system, LytTR family, response regulator